MKKFLIILIFNLSFLFAFGNNVKDIEKYFYRDSFETQEEIKKSDKAVVVRNMKISNIDPALMSEDYSKRIIPLVYETLFEMEADGKIEKNLVEEYNWLTEREIYIKLKSNILFHDNSELVALDIKNSLEFLKERGVLKNIYSQITSIKVLSDRELIIKIAEEDKGFLNSLTYGIASIVKRDNKGKVLGTGKYKVEKINGKETILSKFDAYYGEKGQFKEVIFTWEIDEKQRLINFFNGSVSMAANMKKENVEEGKRLGIISSSDIVFPSKITVTKALVFGEQKEYSLELKKILDKIVLKNKKSFFPNEFLNMNLSNLNGRKYNNINKEYIRERIKYLKIKDINLMILNTESDMEEANKIKNSLKEYGINVKILPHQIEAYNRKLASKNYDMAIFNMAMEKDDLVLLLSTILLNEVKNIDLYNGLLPFFEMLKIENDLENREKIIQKMAFLIQQNIPYIVLDHYKYYTVTTEEFIKLLDEIRKLKKAKGEN